MGRDMRPQMQNRHELPEILLRKGVSGKPDVGESSRAQRRNRVLTQAMRKRWAKTQQN